MTHRNERYNPFWTAALVSLGLLVATLSACDANERTAGLNGKQVRLASLDDFVKQPAASSDEPSASSRSETNRSPDDRDRAEREGPAAETEAEPDSDAGGLDEPAARDSSNAEADARDGGGLRLGSGGQPSDAANDRVQTRQINAEAGQNASTIQPGQRILVESLIGEIHGRPIYADTFFEPIQDRLRAEASEASTSRQFRNTARNIIAQRLYELIKSELVLAEAESSLTEQERQGLINWVREMQERVTAREGGSEYVARRRIAEEQGMTLEQYTQQMRDQGLVQRLVRQEIQPHVIVSWRDVQREYQRRYEQFNPPPKMTIGRIRLSTEREADKIDQVNNMLADDLPFAEIAEAVEQSGAENWRTFEVPAGGIEELGLNETIRNRLKDLDVGDTSEPFQVGSSTWWLHITEIEQPPGRSLYEPQVQRELMDRIEQRRQNEAQRRYVDNLFSEAITDDFEAMLRRLVNIAERRYGP